VVGRQNSKWWRHLKTPQLPYGRWRKKNHAVTIFFFFLFVSPLPSPPSFTRQKKREKMADLKRRLSVLVNQLTSSGALQLNEVCLKDLKSLCKNQDDNVRTVFELVFAHLSKNHSQVRYSAVQISDEFFRRSRVYRELLLENFDVFLDLAAGIRAHPLPPPAPAAPKLQRLTLEVVDGWFRAFGSSYPKASPLLSPFQKRKFS